MRIVYSGGPTFAAQSVARPQNKVDAQDVFSPQQLLATHRAGGGDGKTPPGLMTLRALHRQFPNLGYHGSRVQHIAVLEPRQAKWRDKGGKLLLDGAPAVFVASDYRAAVFLALREGYGRLAAYYIDNQDGALIIMWDVTPDEWHSLKRSNHQGAVYIVNPHGLTVHRVVPEGAKRDNFVDHQKILEFRSSKPLSPMGEVTVTMQDFLYMVKTDPMIRLVDGKGQPLDPT